MAFEPEGDGWFVSYIIPKDIDWPGIHDFELHGGKLSEAYDLEIAAAAALKPLRDLAREATKYRA